MKRDEHDRGGSWTPNRGGRGPQKIRNGTRKGDAHEARRARARGAADPQKGGRGPPKIRKKNGGKRLE